jgi:hypothetical protein
VCFLAALATRLAERMRIGLVMVVGVLLLAGCGEANVPKEPFVGTWRAAGTSTKVVIAKVANGYLSTLVAPGLIMSPILEPPTRPHIFLTRHGGELRGTQRVEKMSNTVEIDYLPNGHLTIRTTDPSSVGLVSGIVNGERPLTERSMRRLRDAVTYGETNSRSTSAPPNGVVASLS